MTRFYKKRSQNVLLTLVLVSIINACGGGSSSESATVDSLQNQSGNASVSPFNLEQASEQDNVEHSALATTGTIVIEERNGKIIFDAYFSQNVETNLPVDAVDYIISEDVCSVSSVDSSQILDAPVQLGAANAEAKYASVGTALIIQSRVGQFEALVKQQVGDITVYAPSERWKSIALPEDATVSFETETNFDQLGMVQVPPLLPLVWLAPETGVMSNPASSLRWEASLDEQVQIMLRLSAIDFSNSQNPTVVTVACSLVDDGTFTLPVEYQHQLPDDDMGIIVYAIRERVQKVQVDNTRLTVVQLSYPAPLAP